MENKYAKITLDGLIFNNPTFMLDLGTCPTLGLISSATSAAGMGLTVVVILTLSNILISAMRKIIPNEVRIPAYIVIIATLVTLARMVLEKLVPDLYDSLGGFLALIVVNCIILGRAEAFANKHNVLESGLFLRTYAAENLLCRLQDNELLDRNVLHSRGLVYNLRSVDCAVHLYPRRVYAKPQS